MKTISLPLFSTVAALLLAVSTAPADNIVSNGDFELPGTGDGIAADDWLKDFNSYGCYDGAARNGAYGLHPGASFGTGGSYQDLATTPGTTYEVRLWIQNFLSGSGSSHLRALAGSAPSSSSSVAVDDQGNNTFAFDSAGLIDNQLVDTQGDGSWSEVTFQFTAAGTATRLGLYNAFMSGDTVHSINIDDASVIPQGGGAEAIANGGFETNSGNGSDPDAWTVDFNSYGAFDGAARTDSWGLHPGASYGTGGRYQDLVTTPGVTYDVSLWIQNFDSAAGSSHVRVLVGAPGITPSQVAVDDQGSTTAQFDNATLVADELLPTAGDGTWSEVTFQFTAIGGTTRLGLYNASMVGDTVHAINIDDVSVESVVPLTLAISRVGGTLSFEWMSQSGKQYDLVSNTDLSTAPATWDPYNDGSNTYEDIAADPSGTNTLSGVAPLGSVRFFAVLEEDIPDPLPLEDFEAVSAPNVPAGWSITPITPGTTSWEGGAPTGDGPGEGANSSAKCAGTNIAGNYDANADVSLITPLISVPAGGATLVFQKWVETEVGASTDDKGTINVLDAGGAFLAELKADIIGDGLGWSGESIALGSYAGMDIKIEFNFVSNGDEHWSGFYIDDVTVTP
ncbi:MAG: hypothetical protein GY720_19430 [bacterium]|nr:hypothetical protein [bacterium]